MVDAVIVVIVISFVILLNFTTEVLNEENQIITKNLLLTSVSIVTFLAFYSAHIQLPGIIGRKGILPVSTTLDTIKEYLSTTRARKSHFQENLMQFMMSLVHEKYRTDENVSHNNSDYIKWIGQVDLALAGLNIVYPHPLLFLYLYVSYYCLKRVGGRFFNFQWDVLLLETLFLSVLLSLSYDHTSTKLCMGLFKWLVFRLMFGSGVVKMFSRDKSWNRDLTAMSYHFLTQPLPNKLGMYVHKYSPQLLFKGMTLGTLVVEGIVPLLSLVPLPWCSRATALLYIVLQLSISATGYFGFFNYLTIVLSFSLLDDAFILKLFHCVISAPVMSRLLETCSIYAYYSITSQVRLLTVFTLLGRAMATLVLVPAVLLVMCTNIAALLLLLERTGVVDNELGRGLDAQQDRSRAGDSVGESESRNSSQNTVLQIRACVYHILQSTIRLLSELHSVGLHTLYLGCHYGLFANMTKVRNEINIEVSQDKAVWYPIELIAKPGDPNLPPKPICPFFHLPRIDWVLWFLAFKPDKQHLPKWFWVFVISVMEDDNPDLMKLLSPNDTHSSTERIPKGKFQYVRINLINYTFAGCNKSLHTDLQAINTGDSSNSSDSGGSSGRSCSDDSNRNNSGGGCIGKQGMGLRVEHKYWSVLPIHVILPPTSLVDVYMILDSFDECIKKSVKERKPPTAEGAKEIIMRTLFAKLKEKKN